jgi:hypothetical protein
MSVGKGYGVRRMERVVYYDAQGASVNLTLSPPDDPLTITPEKDTDGAGQERGRGYTAAAFQALVTERRPRALVDRWLDAGTPLRAIYLGSGENGIWDEWTTPQREDLQRASFQLDGVLLRLALERAGLSVQRHENLLATLTDANEGAWDGVVQRVLPAEGVAVYGYVYGFAGGVEETAGLLLEALDFNGNVLATDGGDADAQPSLTLPAGTWSVRVSVDPERFDRRSVYLTTRPAPAYNGEGGWRLVTEGEPDALGLLQLSPYGPAYETEHTGIDVVYKGQTYVGAGDYYDFGPDAIVIDNGDETLSIPTTLPD